MDDTVDHKQRAAAINQPAALRSCAPGAAPDDAHGRAIEEALKLRLADAPAERLEAMLATVSAAFAARQSKP